MIATHWSGKLTSAFKGLALVNAWLLLWLVLATMSAFANSGWQDTVQLSVAELSPQAEARLASGGISFDSDLSTARCILLAPGESMLLVDPATPVVQCSVLHPSYFSLYANGMDWWQLAEHGVVLGDTFTSVSISPSQGGALILGFTSLAVLLVISLYLRRRHSWREEMHAALAYWRRSGWTIGLPWLLSLTAALVMSAFGIEFKVAEDYAIWTSSVTAVITVIVLAPLAEELFFRGFALDRLRNGLPVFWAIFYTSVVFAAVHGQYSPAYWIPLLLLGISLAWLRLRSGSVLVAVSAHSLNNALAITLGALFAS